MPYRTFFVTEEIGSLNLLREGKPADQVHFVGHVMIDNLFHQVKKLEDENVETYSVFNLKPGGRDVLQLFNNSAERETRA